MGRCPHSSTAHIVESEYPCGLLRSKVGVRSILTKLMMQFDSSPLEVVQSVLKSESPAFRREIQLSWLRDTESVSGSCTPVTLITRPPSHRALGDLR